MDELIREMSIELSLCIRMSILLLPVQIIFSDRQADIGLVKVDKK